jgi:tetratricopeptide (TPR) repeat protein
LQVAVPSTSPPLFQAIECLLGAAAIKPDDANIYSKLGLNYGKNGNLDSAMLAFDAALALDPTHAMARSNKAVALERMGKQEVQSCRWRALASHVSVSCSPRRMLPRRGKKWLGRTGAIWTRMPCKICMGAVFCCWIFAFCFEIELTRALSYNWGIVQNQRMKLKPALRAFKAFCRLFPDNERGWFMMAQVARNMDDVEVLVSASRRLFHLNPNHGEGYGQLGDALSDLKYYLPAISTLRKALEIRRKEPVQSLK